jgi:hypothetical protein
MYEFDLLAFFRLMLVELLDIHEYELTVLALEELAVFQGVTVVRVRLDAFFIRASCVCIYRRQDNLVVFERRLGYLFYLLLLYLDFGNFALGRVELGWLEVVGHFEHLVIAVLISKRVELHEL